MITFNIAPRTLFSKLQPANAKTLERARSFLASREASGGTVLRSALSTAYKYHQSDRLLNLVVFSDGMTEQDSRDQLMAAAKQRPAGVRIFCVGVGNEVNRPLMRQLATDAGGLVAFLSRGDDFDRQAKAFRRKLTKPAMTDVKIAFDGGDIGEVEPRVIPNLYHGTPVRIYGRYGAAEGAKAKLTADINGRPFTQTIDLKLPAKDNDNPEIERMWAWRRIQRLAKSVDIPAQRDAAIAEIVRLGEAYSIVTEHTSFIVLENDAEYKRWRVERRNALRVQRDLAARKRLTDQLETMRSEALAALGPVDPRQRPAERPQPRRAPMPSISLPSFGGPVGPIILAAVGAMGLVELRRRRKRRNQQ